MSTHANRVKMTVTSVAADPYTITLNAASSGYRSFATAYGANATVDVLITQGTTWEVARNCTYTHSGTTLSRGTLEDSSTGARITTIDNTAVVSVIATADAGRRWDSAALEQVNASVTTAGLTGVVGAMHYLDISGLTANRTFTLPATAAVGDCVGVMISVGDDTYGLDITAASGDTFETVAGGTSWGQLNVTGDMIVCRCVAANATWVMQDYKFSAMTIRVTSSTAQSLTGGAGTKLTTSLDSVTSNPVGWWDTTNKKFLPKRRGLWAVAHAMQNDYTPTAIQAYLFLNATTNIAVSSYGYAGAYQVATGSAVCFFDGVDDYIEYYCYSSSNANTAGNGNHYVQFSYIGPG